MKKNLVIVCAGDNSLHTSWGRDGYELWVIYYGNNPEIGDSYRENADKFFSDKGLKLGLIRKLCLLNYRLTQKFDFSDYDYIWIPDDDLQFLPGDSPGKLFDVCHKIEPDVFQPAVENDYISKAWEPTKRVLGNYARRTNIVEIMAFGFSGKVFQECFLTALHSSEFVESGWGIEPIIKNIGESLYGRYLNTYVIDALPIIHTRPVGTGGGIVHARGIYEAQHFPQIEPHRMKNLQNYKSIDDLLADNVNYLDVDDSKSKLEAYQKLFNYWYQRILAQK